jgi:hypothetical protein
MSCTEIKANHKFIKSLPSSESYRGLFSYQISGGYRYPVSKVRGVRFAQGRYHKNLVKMEFARPMNWQDALQVVERYLAQPLTPEHFQKLANSGDLFPSSLPEDFKVIGDCLGDCKFVDSLNVSSSGIMEIECGS